MSLLDELGKSFNKFQQQMIVLDEFARENLGWDGKDPAELSTFFINKFKAMEERIDDLEMDLEI